MLGLELAYMIPALAGTPIPLLVHTNPGSASTHSLLHSPDFPGIGFNWGLNGALAPVFSQLLVAVAIWGS